MKKLSKTQIQKFQSTVWDYYHTHGRHDLPWRPQKKKVNPYHILVSEIMLQQTQVPRVIPKFLAFIKLFPTFEILADASLADVLRVWQGLGYTRRAKFLHMCAQKIISEYGGVFPKSIEELAMLPGIGPYTARALYTFIYNKPVALIETNIRTVYIHHFFKDAQTIADTDILHCVEQTLAEDAPREWMYALMDYGSYLKSKGMSHNARSKSHIKQKPLRGSVREVRGSIMKFLAEKEKFTQEDRVQFEKKFDAERVEKALDGLVKDMLIAQEDSVYVIRS